MDAPRPTRRVELWAQVVTGAPDVCWNWVGGSLSGYGYPRFSVNGKQQYAHRLVHEWHVGPIPDGYEVDHLCGNSLCLNPNHLEAVPPLVNLARNGSPASVNARKTHCKHGHEFTPENTIYNRGGGRKCRECKRRKDRVAR